MKSNTLTQNEINDLIQAASGECSHPSYMPYGFHGEIPLWKCNHCAKIRIRSECPIID